MIGPTELTKYELDSPLPPKAVVAALVDFSDQRLTVWRETSHPNIYRVHARGDTWADVTEGVPYAWSRERYDWSEPGIVALRQVESNIALPGGTITYRVAARQPSGSHIVCERRRMFRGVAGRLLGTYMLILGPSILKRQLKAGLRRTVDQGLWR